MSEVERIALVAENTYNPVVIADTDRKIVWVNPAFTNLTGYSLDEVAGKSPVILHCEKTDKKEIQRVADCLSRRERVSAELINRNKFGREYWVRFHINPVEVNNRFVGYISVEEEITKEVELINGLKESELKYRALYNSSQDRSIFIDKNYILRAYNKSAKKNFKKNFDVDIQEGADFRTYLPNPAIAKLFHYAFDQAIGGKDFFFEESVDLADGRKQWYEFRGTPVLDEEGNIIGGSFNWRENTKEKHLTVLLEESELKYKAIIDSTDDRHVLIDRNNAVLAFNKSALRNLSATFGFEMKEGDNFLEYFKGHEHVFKLEKGIASALNNEPWYYESRVDTKGTIKWLKINYLPVHDNTGAVVRVSVTWSDITAQKETEQKVLNQLKQLREFSYITSHKLRQPLANIIGLTDLISSPSTTKEDMLTLLGKLRHVASDLDDVINTMTLTVNTAGYVENKAGTVSPQHKIDTVFIVDDDPVNNLITSRLIKKAAADVAVEEFQIAEQALNRLKEGNNPGLILLDINMHPMDGWAFLSELQRLGIKTNVVMCSSSVDPADLLKAQGHPLVNRFISKPVTADHIKSLIFQ